MCADELGDGCAEYDSTGCCEEDAKQGEYGGWVVT